MREALDKKNKKEKGVHEDGPLREKAHGSEVLDGAARRCTAARPVAEVLPDALLRPENASMQFGRSYEEFEVGATYKHWPGKTVTESDDHLFCLLTMNHHPLHLDAHYAEETTQFGKNVVVGNYVYSILLGMSVPDVSGKAIANLEIESLRHVAPTFHGDTLYGETTVLDKWESKSKDDRGVVHVETIGYNQDGKVVCIFRRKVMVPKQSYLDERGGEQPGRPVPQPDKNWPGADAPSLTHVSTVGWSPVRREQPHRRAPRRGAGTAPGHPVLRPAVAVGQPVRRRDVGAVQLLRDAGDPGPLPVLLRRGGGLGISRTTATGIVGAYGGAVYLATIIGRVGLRPAGRARAHAVRLGLRGDARAHRAGPGARAGRRRAGAEPRRARQRRGQGQRHRAGRLALRRR